MITLPSLAGVPPILTPLRSDALAARYALALAEPGPIARPPWGGGKNTLEHAVLIREVEARFERAAAALQIFRPRLHITMGVPPVECDCREKAAAPITIWLANANNDVWDSRWALERRWAELERRHKGLAQTALEAIDRASFLGVPVLTPAMALRMAQFCWWAGEADERYVLAEWHGIEEPEKGDEDHGIPRRAWLDKVLPPEASGARAIVRESTLRYQGELGRQILELREATREAKRRRNKARRFHMHTQLDELWCVGFGATLRWNTRDPIPRIFDDHANGLAESYAVEDAWGWFIVGSPKELQPFLEELERRFALARLVENLIGAIAERSRE